MPKPEPEPEEEPREDLILNERQERAARRTLNLVELGFSMQQVLRMRVGRQLFDWHEAERLLKKGETHEQVTFRLEE